MGFSRVLPRRLGPHPLRPRRAASGSVRAGGARPAACVAYCLRIVDLDPITYDLLFERFLNPGRKQMPDIDMDFDSRYRGEMIRYAAERYGRDHVAQIVTFSTIKARAAVRDAARVLGYPYAVGDKIAKAMPPLVMGRDTPLHACLEPNDRSTRTATRWPPSCATMYDADPDAKRVIDVATGLEGLRRQDGIHAAAVVITKRAAHRVPARSSASPSPAATLEDAPIVTQYEMHGVEELGLLKMDFLGLRNLDVIDDHARPHRADHRASTSTSTTSRSTTSRPSSCCGGATRSACSSSRAGRCARCMRSLAPDHASRTSPPSSRSTGRARWRRTCTTTTPTARTAASRSRTSTPTSRRSSATPTG